MSLHVGDDEGGGARFVPVVGEPTVREQVEDGEGVVEAGCAVEAEAVVVVLHPHQEFLAGEAHLAGCVVDPVREVPFKLLLRVTNNVAEALRHGDVHQVVHGGEDAGLCELGDAGQHDEAEVLVAAFEDGVEGAEGAAHSLRRLQVADLVQDGLVVLVDQDDDRAALPVEGADKLLKLIAGLLAGERHACIFCPPG